MCALEVIGNLYHDHFLRFSLPYTIVSMISATLSLLFFWTFVVLLKFGLQFINNSIFLGKNNVSERGLSAGKSRKFEFRKYLIPSSITQRSLFISVLFNWIIFQYLEITGPIFWDSLLRKMPGLLDKICTSSEDWKNEMEACSTSIDENPLNLISHLSRVYNNLLGSSQELIGHCLNGFLVGSIFLILILLSFSVFGFIAAFVKGSYGREISSKEIPNIGVLRSFSNSLIFGFTGGFLVGFIYYLVFKVMTSGTYSDDVVFSQDLSLSFIIGFWIISYNLGGSAFNQHLSLRCVLFWENIAPWNYARFLNHCTDRLLLQRVGGRYRFIHRLVQEHFAAMPLEQGREGR